MADNRLAMLLGGSTVHITVTIVIFQTLHAPHHGNKHVWNDVALLNNHHLPKIAPVGLFSNQMRPRKLTDCSSVPSPGYKMLCFFEHMMKHAFFYSLQCATGVSTPQSMLVVALTALKMQPNNVYSWRFAYPCIKLLETLKGVVVGQA